MTNENEDGVSNYKEKISNFTKTAFARFGIALLLTSIVTIAANVAIVTYFLSELTDQLDSRIESTNQRLESFEIESNRLRREAIDVSRDTTDVIIEIRERLARIEAQSELSSSILIGVRDGEQSLPRLEDQIPNLDELLEEFAPMGGPDATIVVGFPPARKILPFNTPVSELERQRQILSENFQRGLTGGFGPQLDPQRHQIDVRHGLFYNGNEDEIVIVLVAYVVEK